MLLYWSLLADGWFSPSEEVGQLKVMHKGSNCRVGKSLPIDQIVDLAKSLPIDLFVMNRSCSPASSLNKHHACNKGAELEMQAQCNE